MLGNYDRWKLEDGDDPGRGSATQRSLHCQGCDWHGDFSGAVEHFRQTDHAITFKGVVQDFERYRIVTEVVEVNR